MPLLNCPILLPTLGAQFLTLTICGRGTQAAAPCWQRWYNWQTAYSLQATATDTDWLPACARATTAGRTLGRDLLYNYIHGREVAFTLTAMAVVFVTIVAVSVTIPAASATTIGALVSEFGSIASSWYGRLLVCTRIRPKSSWSYRPRRRHPCRLSLF